MELTAVIHKTFESRARIAASLQIVGDAPTVILFGASGAGKTTVLRCLAGLEAPDTGRIVWNGTVWTDTASGKNVPPQQRGIGFLFQDHALFPHLNVEQNIAYGLQRRTPGERQRRIDQIAAMLQIDDLRRQRPSELSGGQQQRVALARTIAPSPQLLLLDEPFSALDRPTHDLIRSQISRLLREVRIPAIVVTHDWTDALSMGDELIAMSGGRVRQTGKPHEVFSHPQHLEVAAAVGVDTIIAGRVIAQKNDLLTVRVGEVDILATTNPAVVSACYLCIRSEDVTLEKAPAGQSSARNRLKGTIREITPAATGLRITIDVGFDLVSLVTREAASDLHLSAGSEVYAVIKASAVHLIERENA